MYYHYYENGEHAVSPHFGMQTRRYKLIRFYDKVNSWELYDLEKDPHEMHNVFGEKGYEKIAVRLKAKLVSLIDRMEIKMLSIFSAARRRIRRKKEEMRSFGIGYRWILQITSLLWTGCTVASAQSGGNIPVPNQRQIA